MDKLYSKRALLIKGVYCFFLPLLHILATSGALAQSLGWLFVSSVLLGCLYTVPFWLSLSRLRKSCDTRGTRVGGYIAKDAGCCLLPAVLSALLYEIGMFLFAEQTSLTGLYTLLLFFIFLLISGVFWLWYKIVGKHNRP